MTTGGPPPTPPSSAGLTFGVEIEAFAAMEPRAFARSQYEDLRFLVASRIGARHLGDVHAFVPTPGESFESFVSRDYTCWNVVRDMTIEPVDEEHFAQHEAFALEIVSPILRLDSPVWEALLKKIFRQTTFNPCGSMSPRLYLETNRTTHLHVHLGRGQQGFDFDTVRNFALLVLLFEPDIDKVIQRRIGFRGRANDHAVSHDRLMNVDYPQLSFRELSSLLWQGCRTIEEVAAFMCPTARPHKLGGLAVGRYYKFNFTSLLSDKKTIECRQHDGTMDAGEIIDWVRLLELLVLIAMALTPEQRELLVRDRTQSPQCMGIYLELIRRLKRVPSRDEAADYAALLVGSGDPDGLLEGGVNLKTARKMRTWFQDEDLTRGELDALSRWCF